MTDTGPSEFRNLEDSIELTINKSNYHPSILMIKNKFSHKERLSFQEVSLSEVEKEIKIPKKAITQKNMPVKILKLTIMFIKFSDFLMIEQVSFHHK